MSDASNGKSKSDRDIVFEYLDELEENPQWPGWADHTSAIETIRQLFGIPLALACKFVSDYGITVL